MGAPRCANYPRGPVVSPSLTYGCPFHLAATPRQLSSPKRGPLGPFLAPPPGPTVSESLWVGVSPVVRGRRGTLAGQRGRPLCPGETTSHPIESRRPAVSRVGNGVCGTPRCFGRLRGVAPRLGPKRGSSRTVRAWPLRQRPLPTAAGCVPFPSGRFEPGFPHGHGPARVGLGRSGMGIDRTVCD